ncbi:MAG: hypothetical protein L6R41_004918 [Letrouitia leprolyta]|nr:MAG: hypothetical protein L6R41_004918 [Letrouitia leprolyta]
MFSPFLVLCYMLLPSIIPTIKAYQIVFADYTTSAFSILQHCSSDGFPDICCEILDLDVRDKRGYGWFRSTQVVFRDLESPDTRAAVFARAPPSVPAQRHKTCVGKILTQRKGDKDWVTERLGGEGAGSAAVITGVRTKGLRQVVPSVIVLRGRTFRLFTSEEEEELAFRDGAGNVSLGRRLGVEKGLLKGAGNGNGTTGADVA